MLQPCVACSPCTCSSVGFARRWRRPRPGWAPDPPMVGIRSPIGLVVGLAPATLEFWVRFQTRDPGQVCRYGEAPAAAASWRANDGGLPPSLQIPPHTHILLARSPAPYSLSRRRAQSPTAFSGPMARPPPSPPRPPPSHIHAGWMVSATRTLTSSAPSQDYLFPPAPRVPVSGPPSNFHWTAHTWTC